MHTIAEVAEAVLKTFGPDDVTPIYKAETIFAVSVAGKRYRLDTTDRQLDDLLRLIGAPRKLN